jgi:hypothetical protein
MTVKKSKQCMLVVYPLASSGVGCSTSQNHDPNDKENQFFLPRSSSSLRDLHSCTSSSAPPGVDADIVQAPIDAAATVGHQGGGGGGR